MGSRDSEKERAGKGLSEKGSEGGKEGRFGVNLQRRHGQEGDEGRRFRRTGSAGQDREKKC